MTGRPAWIPTDSVCEEAREMASNGLTAAQIADCLGISESTATVTSADGVGAKMESLMPAL